MKNRYYLGVDGGGSKTTAVVSDSCGRLIFRSVGGSINYYSVGLEAARENMRSIINRLCSQTGIGGFCSVCVGMSALAGEATAEEAAAFAHGIIDADKLMMHSDVYVALKCLVTSAARAVVISGTGSMLAATRGGNSPIETRGGWGYILGDEGSGYSISLNAAKYAVRAYDGVEKDSLLCGAVLEHFGVRQMPQLIERFYNPTISRKEIASFASSVFACAVSGDEAAVRIVTNEARLLAAAADALLKDYPDDTRLGLWGGIFENYPLFRNAFIDELNLSRANIKPALLEYPAEIGALFAALEQDGIEITPEITENVNL